MSGWATGPEPPAVKKMSEEQRLTRQQTYIEALYRAAVKQLGQVAFAYFFLSIASIAANFRST